jgi:hypothetical protein
MISYKLNLYCIIIQINSKDPRLAASIIVEAARYAALASGAVKDPGLVGLLKK